MSNPRDSFADGATQLSTIGIALSCSLILALLLANWVLR